MNHDYSFRRGLKGREKYDKPVFRTVVSSSWAKEDENYKFKISKKSVKHEWQSH